MPEAKPLPGKLLLSPTDHTLIMIDFQSQMAFATKSIDAVNLRNNAGLAASAAAEFRIPTILTTGAEKTFSGPMFSEIMDAFPGQTLIDRTSMNTWEDAEVIKEVNAIGKKRVALAGLWTSVCIVGSALSALDQGYEVCVVADACGDVSTEAHGRAMGEPGHLFRPHAQCGFAVETGYAAWRDPDSAGEYGFRRKAAMSCGCANSCGVHGHDHAAAWSSDFPISDLKSFWARSAAPAGPV